MSQNASPRPATAGSGPQPPPAPSQVATPPAAPDGPAHATPMQHMHSDHEVSARGSDSPRSTARLAGSTEPLLPWKLMSEAKAGNQTGLRSLKAPLPRLLSTLHRPGLP